MEENLNLESIQNSGGKKYTIESKCLHSLNPKDISSHISISKPIKNYKINLKDGNFMI